jgi:cell division protein FtsQ
MARKSSPTILQEELYPLEDDAPRESADARLLDLEVEQESPFLRGQKRIAARRGPLPRKAAARLKWVALALFFAGTAGIAARLLYQYGEHSWRFRIESSDDIEIVGTQNVARAQVLEVMGGDIGRNLFFVPLAQRKTQLEQIPWVESASVMRFVPNRLRVEIHERTPIAFARVGSKILMTDGSGALMELPTAGKTKYSFPVIVGMNHGEPLSTRAARMKIYSQLVHELDAGGANYSRDLSEVDLSDPDDVKVLAADPSGEVLIHLGSSNFLDRYKIYVSRVQEWRQQFTKLESVDLRYEHQIIVNPDLSGTPRQAPLSRAAVKAAMAAGVKPAALVTHDAMPPRAKAVASFIGPVAKPAQKPAPKPNAKARRSRRTTRKRAAKATDVTTEKFAAKNAAPPPVGTAAGSAAVPKSASDAAKPGAKPSPAIPKGQDHP